MANLAPIPKACALLLHDDTISYISYLSGKWGIKSQSGVVEELVRRVWKAEQLAQMKKLDKAKKIA